MVLTLSASWVLQWGCPPRRDSPALPSGAFPLPVTRPVPGPGPHYPGPTLPLTSASLCARRAWLYFSIPSAQKGSVFFFTSVTSTPQSAGGRRWAGDRPFPVRWKRPRRLCLVCPCQGGGGSGGKWPAGGGQLWLRIPGSRSFPATFWGSCLCPFLRSLNGALAARDAGAIGV